MPDIIKDLNLNKNELKNVVVETAPSLSSAPSSPRKNQIYFNSTNNVLYRYNGTTWVADNKVGQIYFNTSDNNLYRYNGSNWVTYQAPITTTAATAIEIPNGILKGSSGSITTATSGTDYQAPLPLQTGNSGKFLTTNGSALSWANTSLPPYCAEFSILQGIDEETVSCDTSISSLIQMFGERPVYGISDGAIFQLILVDSNSVVFQLQSDTAIITITGTINQSTDVWEIYYLYLQQQINFDGTYNASTNKAATQSTVTNAINALDGGTIGTGGTTKTITSLSQTNGNVSATFSDIAFPVTSVNTKTGAVSLTAADVGAATSSDISTAINTLDGSITGTAGAGKTFTAFSQTNGKVTATFGDISITKSQVSDFPTIPGGSSTSPKMDGTATVGTETAWAHGDHIHPSDTNKQDKITASGILKGNGSGTITAATAGTDYQAPLPSQTGNSGKFLTTNGSTMSWETVDTEPEIFVATVEQYGQNNTTAAEIAAAKEAGKLLFLKFTGWNINCGLTPITKCDVINMDEEEVIYQILAYPISDVTYSYRRNVYELYWDNDYSDWIINNIGEAELPSQENNSGKFLTTNGSTASWETIPSAPVSSVNTKTGNVVLTAADVGAIPTSAKGAASGVAPLNSSSKIDSTYLPSYVDDVIEGYYNSTDGKFYEESTYTTEITPEAGKIYIDLSTNKSYRWGGTTYVEMPTGSTVSVTQGLSSGTTVGTITIDGTTTTLYAPEDTDTKVTQTKATASSYTYWRPVPVGSLSASTATTAFATTATTDRIYSFDNFRFQPSTGTLRVSNITAYSAQGSMDTVRGTVKAHSYIVSAANSDTSSYMSSDSENNIWFMVGPTSSSKDCVLCLYSNGTTKTVRAGGSAAGTVDLGTSTNNWKDLYLGGTIYNSPSSTTVASGDKILVNDTSAGTISSGITLGSSTTQYLANDGSWQNIPTVPTNCEVTVTHIAGTWNVDTTYASMIAAHNAGGIVYFTYGSYTAIASFHTSNTVTANIMYMDSEGIYQMQITVNSSDEVDCTETNYTFPTIYNGETS